VYDKSGNEQETEASEAVFQILQILAQYTKEEALLSKIFESYHNYIKPGGDLSEQLLKFLTNEYSFFFLLFFFFTISIIVNKIK